MDKGISLQISHRCQSVLRSFVCAEGLATGQGGVPAFAQARSRDDAGTAAAAAKFCFKCQHARGAQSKRYLTLPPTQTNI